MAKRLREAAQTPPAPDNVIPLHNPAEDRAYDALLDGVVDTIEGVFAQELVDDEEVRVLAFQACATVLGNLEAQLLEREFDATTLDLIRQTRADEQFETAISKHAEGCGNADCDTRRRMRAARRRYAPAVQRMVELSRERVH